MLWREGRASRGSRRTRGDEGEIARRAPGRHTGVGVTRVDEHAVLRRKETGIRQRPCILLCGADAGANDDV